VTEPIRIVQGDPWWHRCLLLPGNEGKPTPIWMQGCACVYCAQPAPDEQKKIDAKSAELLRERRNGTR
jgi:hypothetical protein